MAKLTLEKIKEIARRARDNIASDFTEHQLWHENPNLVNDAARDLQEQQEEEDQIIDKAIKDGRYYYVYWVFYSWEDYNWIASRHKYPRDRGEEKINVEQIARKDEHFIRVDNPQGKCRKFGKFLYGRGKVKFQDPFPVDVPATAIHEDILEGLKDGKYILALGVALDTSGKGAGDINFDPEQMNWKWDHWAHGILDTKEDVGIIKGRLVDVMDEKIVAYTDSDGKKIYDSTEIIPIYGALPANLKLFIGNKEINIPDSEKTIDDDGRFVIKSVPLLPGIVVKYKDNNNLFEHLNINYFGRGGDPDDPHNRRVAVNPLELRKRENNTEENVIIGVLRGIISGRIIESDSDADFQNKSGREIYEENGGPIIPVKNPDVSKLNVYRGSSLQDIHQNAKVLNPDGTFIIRGLHVQDQLKVVYDEKDHLETTWGRGGAYQLDGENKKANRRLISLDPGFRVELPDPTLWKPVEKYVVVPSDDGGPPPPPPPLKGRVVETLKGQLQGLKDDDPSTELYKDAHDIGIPGAEVLLVTLDTNDAIHDGNGVLIPKQQTDNHGKWKIENITMPLQDKNGQPVAAGNVAVLTNYIKQTDDPNIGFSSSIHTQGPYGRDGLDAPPENPVGIDISQTRPGKIINCLDKNERPPPPRISGRVVYNQEAEAKNYDETTLTKPLYKDKEIGTEEGIEVALVSMTMEPLHGNDNKVLTTTTDPKGYWTFDTEIVPLAGQDISAGIQAVATDKKDQPISHISPKFGRDGKHEPPDKSQSIILTASPEKREMVIIGIDQDIEKLGTIKGRLINDTTPTQFQGKDGHTIYHDGEKVKHFPGEAKPTLLRNGKPVKGYKFKWERIVPINTQDETVYDCAEAKGRFRFYDIPLTDGTKGFEVVFTHKKDKASHTDTPWGRGGDPDKAHNRAGFVNLIDLKNKDRHNYTEENVIVALHHEEGTIHVRIVDTLKASQNPKPLDPNSATGEAITKKKDIGLQEIDVTVINKDYQNWTITKETNKHGKVVFDVPLGYKYRVYCQDEEGELIYHDTNGVDFNRGGDPDDPKNQPLKSAPIIVDNRANNEEKNVTIGLGEAIEEFGRIEGRLIDGDKTDSKYEVRKGKWIYEKDEEIVAYQPKGTLYLVAGYGGQNPETLDIKPQWEPNKKRKFTGRFVFDNIPMDKGNSIAVVYVEGDTIEVKHLDGPWGRGGDPKDKDQRPSDVNPINLANRKDKTERNVIVGVKGKVQKVKIEVRVVDNEKCEDVGLTKDGSTGKEIYTYIHNAGGAVRTNIGVGKHEVWVEDRDGNKVATDTTTATGDQKGKVIFEVDNNNEYTVKCKDIHSGDDVAHTDAPPNYCRGGDPDSDDNRPGHTQVITFPPGKLEEKYVTLGISEDQTPPVILLWPKHEGKDHKTPLQPEFGIINPNKYSWLPGQEGKQLAFNMEKVEGAPVNTHFEIKIVRVNPDGSETVVPKQKDWRDPKDTASEKSVSISRGKKDSNKGWMDIGDKGVAWELGGKTTQTKKDINAQIKVPLKAEPGQYRLKCELYKKRGKQILRDQMLEYNYIEFNVISADQQTEMVAGEGISKVIELGGDQ